MMPNILGARNRILDSAKKVFAEKGFDGSRINDVSELANVPKSLIYYHFKSKDELLETMISEFITEYKQLLKIAENDTHAHKSKQMTNRLQNHYYDFAIQNLDVIRIMFVESLKKSTEIPVIFKVVEEIVRIENPNTEDVNERLVAEFFTSLIPLYSYLCFYDKWCTYFDIERKEFDQLFLAHMEQTHGAYHKNFKKEGN